MEYKLKKILKLKKIRTKNINMKLKFLININIDKMSCVNETQVHLLDKFFFKLYFLRKINF